MESCFVPAGPIYIRIFVHNYYAFVTLILRIVKRYSLHRLELGFINIFITKNGLSCFTTLNVMHLHRSMRDAVDLKCSVKWATDESEVCTFLKDAGHQRNDHPLFS